MVWKPHVTVAALAEDDAGRFLMVEERIGGELVLNQPAGHLEAGESLLDAVRREAMEETGWIFEPEAVVGVYRWAHPASGDTFLRTAFHGRAVERDAGRTLDAEIVSALWLGTDEIRRREAALRSPLVWRCIADYLAGRRYPLDVFKEF